MKKTIAAERVTLTIHTLLRYAKRNPIEFKQFQENRKEKIKLQNNTEELNVKIRMKKKISYLSFDCSGFLLVIGTFRLPCT